MENDRSNGVYSKIVRAGKRTYFFDIKTTKGNDLYIVLTESKKSFLDDGSDNFQKHKIFLYKEDFEKFKEGFEEVMTKMEELKMSGEYQEKEAGNDSYSSVFFEDL
jgi:hypothetical protein